MGLFAGQEFGFQLFDFPFVGECLERCIDFVEQIGFASGQQLAQLLVADGLLQDDAAGFEGLCAFRTGSLALSA